MNFHVIGLPSTRTNEFSSCAFTALTANFVKMMRSLGHKVYHYGVGCDVDCEEDIELMYPVSMDWSGGAKYWTQYNETIINEVNKRKTLGDFVCVINGRLNQLLENISHVQVVEYAIGYTGTFAKYRVFASYSHMHKIWGAQGGLDPDGKFYDAVIPHYLDPNHYTLQTKKSDYFLYIGRLVSRKGVQVAVDTCKELGARLVIAGSGEQVYKGGNLEYVGPVSGQERLDLYRNAKATFVPTLYVEPFGMTVIESQMCGTPVITTDWGAFPETVEQGRVGFRCRTLDQFVRAAKSIQDLDPVYIRDFAIKNWSLNVIKYRYQEYFNTLADLWGQGWKTIHQ